MEESKACYKLRKLLYRGTGKQKGLKHLILKQSGTKTFSLCQDIQEYSHKSLRCVKCIIKEKRV